MSPLLPPQDALQALRAKFSRLPDPRQAGKVLYRLDEVLLIA
ncbi:MAG: ISAs1 family transposase, partial [Verrucomicrobium sp.]